MNRITLNDLLEKDALNSGTSFNTEKWKSYNCISM